MASNPTSEALVNMNFAGQDALTLHTPTAIRYFNGNWPSGRVYLIQFARLMSQLWEATAADDPYAEQVLYQTYDRLMQAKQFLDEASSYIEKQFTVLTGFEIRLYTNPHPLKQRLFFKTPFAFMGARLLRDCDELFRRILTLRKFGIPEVENYNHKKIVDALAATYAFPRSWQKTDVTRADIMEQTPRALKAERLLGKVSLAVLEKKIVFPFKPRAHRVKETHSVVTT